MNELSIKLEQAAKTLKAATREVYLAQEANLAARANLDDAQKAILNANAEDPKKLGANEAARQAKLDELTSTEVENARVAAASLRQRQHELDMAKLDMDLLRHLKHLQAIAAGVSLN